MMNLPTGTVTFVFTDIEGSTTRWEQHPAEMKAALAQHDTLMRGAFAAHAGTVIQTAGDSFVIVFARPDTALTAILESQRALRDAVWPAPIGPLRVRAALHSGPGEQREDGYHAEFTLNRLARLLAAGHGGEILSTDTTRDLLNGATPAGVGWRDLGECWLKDLIRPFLHIYQVLAPDLPHDFPPLRTLDAAPPPAGPTLDGAPDVENPYKGLRAFGETDAPDFFGREALTEQVVARLGEAVPLARFLAVVGPSGSGKSSVVRAGVLPALRRGGLPGSEHWRIVELIPGAEPFQELAAAFGAATGQDAAILLEQLQADEYGLLRVAQHGSVPVPATPPTPNPQPPTPILLVIDQFEEVFTLVADEPARVHFLESLHRAVTGPDSPIRVIVTLRADFYDRPLLYPDPGELLRQRTEVVLPLTPEELARAIGSPAARVGVQIEATLVGAMIQDVAEQPGTLPLLEYALTELFERREGTKLTLAAYRASGGMQGALTRRADAIYGGLTEPEQEVTRQVFLRLVTLGEGTEDTRRRVRRAELVALSMAVDTLDGVLEAFSRYRLLTFDRDPATREPTVEVAHEALIRSWGRLRAWLDASRAALQVQRQLGEAAAEWARAGQDSSFLAGGGRLAQFTALAAAGDVALTAQERAYLAESQADAERRTRVEQTRQRHELVLQQRAASRLRVLLGGAVLFLLVAAGLALFGFDQSQTAQANAHEANNQRATAVANADQSQANFRRADAERLAAEANTLLAQSGGGASDELIALLSVRSMNMEYTPGGAAALAAAGTLIQPRLVITDMTTANSTYLLNGQYLLTSSTDGLNTDVWDVAAGKHVHRFPGLRSPPRLSNPGKYFETTDQKTVWLWDVTTLAEVRHVATLAGGVTADGKTFCYLTLPPTLICTDAASGQVTANFALPAFKSTPAIAADNKQLVIQDPNGALSLWDMAAGQQIRPFHGTNTDLLWMSFSPDGRRVLTQDPTTSVLSLWDPQTGEKLHDITIEVAGAGVAVFSPDSKRIATAVHAVGVVIGDVQTGAEVRRLTGFQNEITTFAFSPDGQSMLVGGYDNTVRLLNAVTGAELRRFTGFTSGVGTVWFSPDGRYVGAAGTNEGGRLWDLQSTRELPQFVGHTALLNSVAFSPDGRQVLTASDDGTRRLWDAATGQELRQFGHDIGLADFAVFSPDGHAVLAADADAVARIRNTTTAQQVQQFSGPGVAGASPVAFSPDGKYALTVGGAGRVTPWLWDVKSGQQVRTFPGHTENIEGVAFSPDGQRLATASNDKTARLWDVQTGQELHRLTGHTDVVWAVAFSPDGKTVATMSADGTARLWNAQSGAEIRRFAGHMAVIYQGVFSPDGKYLLTGSEDKTARLWDVQTGAEVLRFTGHTAGGIVVAYAPDGKHVLTGSADGTARLWDTDYHTTIDWLCAHLPRDFTADERAGYGITDSNATCPKQ